MKKTYAVGRRWSADWLQCDDNYRLIGFISYISFSVARWPSRARPASPFPSPPTPIGAVEQKFMNDETFLWLNERLRPSSRARRRRRQCRVARAHPYFSGAAERRVAERAPATTRNVSRLWIIHSRQRRGGAYLWWLDCDAIETNTWEAGWGRWAAWTP